MAEPPAPGDQQRGHDRRGLAEDREHDADAGVGLRAQLARQRPELQRDDRAEGDGDQRGRQDRDAGDEPGLLDELAELERPLGQRRGRRARRRRGCRSRPGAGSASTCRRRGPGPSAARSPSPRRDLAGAWRRRRAPAPRRNGASVAAGPDRLEATGVGHGQEVLGQRPADRLAAVSASNSCSIWRDPLLRRRTSWRSGRPSVGSSCGRDGVAAAGALRARRRGGSPPRSSSASISASACAVSFSSDMPIGPWRRPFRNCATTGSSQVSSCSRGPNMARCCGRASRGCPGPSAPCRCRG